MIKALIFLFLSQISLAAESRKYIRVGENPVKPGLILEGERIFQVKYDTYLTTLDKSGGKHTGWLASGYHFVGRLEDNQWRAVRIYECGNPILNPRIILKNPQEPLYNPKPKVNCRCSGNDWFLWTVGPGLVGYGGGVRETVPMGVGGGIIVIDLLGKSDPKTRKCMVIKKGLIGAASAGIGWLIGNALYKPERPRQNPGSPSSGGPGPTPPNGVALRF